MEENGNGLGLGILGAAGLGIAGTIWNTVAGRKAQEREFAQQEYLMDKQNEYNDPRNQMQRMLAAGINPNVAGTQIAANQVSASPAQVPTNSANAAGAFGQAASAVSELAKTPSEITANTAGAAKDAAEAKTEDELRHERLNQIKAAWQVDDMTAQTLAMQLDNVEAEQLSRIQNLVSQSEMFNAQRDVYIKQLELFNAQINELNATADKESALELQIKKQNFMLDFRNQCATIFGIDINQPVESQAFLVGLKYGLGSEQADKAFYDLYSIYNEKEKARRDRQEEIDKNLSTLELDKYKEQLKAELSQKYAELPASLLEDVLNFVFAFKLKKIPTIVHNQ